MVNIINIFSYPEINKLKTPKNKDSLNDVIKNDFISFLVDMWSLKSFILNGEVKMEVIKSLIDTRKSLKILKNHRFLGD